MSEYPNNVIYYNIIKFVWNKPRTTECLKNTFLCLEVSYYLLGTII